MWCFFVGKGGAVWFLSIYREGVPLNHRDFAPEGEPFRDVFPLYFVLFHIGGGLPLVSRQVGLFAVFCRILLVVGEPPPNKSILGIEWDPTLLYKTISGL